MRKALFTEEERAALDEARKKYVPPDPTKFRLTLASRYGRVLKDREYKTFQAAENALKKAIKKDHLSGKPELYRAKIWPPGEPKYGDETSYNTDYKLTSSSYWYKTTPDQNTVMLKVFS